MEEEQILVIVSVYNTEKYLDQCIQSILKQTYHNLELILVDDGSSDKSGDICDDYASQDVRIRSFHQENRGITATRNRGIAEAAGEYIAFIDNDDEYLPDILDDEPGLPIYMYTDLNEPVQRNPRGGQNRRNPGGNHAGRRNRRRN